MRGWVPGSVYRLSLAAALVAALVVASPTSAQVSTLEQIVHEPDCTIPSDCDMTPPVISQAVKHGNKPIITGTYDAAFSKVLRVSFGGVLYTLGVDPELAVENGVWVLSLASLSSPLPAGMYELIVETEGYDGRISRVETVVVLTPLEQSDGPETPIWKPIQSVSQGGGLDRQTPSGGGDERTPDEQPGTDEATVTPEEQTQDIPRPMTPEEVRKKLPIWPYILVLSATAFVGATGLMLVRRKK